MWHVDTTERYSATRKNKITPSAATWEPGGLPSTGPHRVRHARSDLAAAATWRQLEIITPSETPQKDKCHVAILICGL